MSFVLTRLIVRAAPKMTNKKRLHLRPRVRPGGHFTRMENLTWRQQKWTGQVEKSAWKDLAFADQHTPRRPSDPSRIVPDGASRLASQRDAITQPWVARSYPGSDSAPNLLL